MADFSESEIEEAKRRVREMKNKANQLLTEKNRDAHSPPDKPTEKSECPKNKEEESDSSDQSLFIILTLIMILLREGADGKLILALLYLLL